MSETKKYVQILNGCYVKDAEAREKANKNAEDILLMDITLSGTRSTANEALQTANDAKAIAEGKTNAKVYTDFQALVTDLLDTSTNYPVGTNLLVKVTDCPDYWITSNDNNPPTNSANGMGKQDANNMHEGYTIGKYTIQILETAKVVLTDYATKNDLKSYVTKTDAGTTYLTKATAQSDYLKKADAVEQYPTRSDVTQAMSQAKADADASYVKKSEAGVTYSEVDESLTITLPTT